jgi:hypothetical protein
MSSDKQPKRMTVKQIKHYTGKRVNSVKWQIPDGYERCAMTGKMYPDTLLEVSFPHTLFDRDMLLSNHIYVEDAEWLSQEGFELILMKLEQIGVDFYAVLDAEFDRILSIRSSHFLAA